MTARQTVLKAIYPLWMPLEQVVWKEIKDFGQQKKYSTFPVIL